MAKKEVPHENRNIEISVCAFCCYNQKFQTKLCGGVNRGVNKIKCAKKSEKILVDSALYFEWNLSFVACKSAPSKK